MTILSIFGMELDKVILNFFMKVKKGLILNTLMMERGEEVFISHKMPSIVYVIPIIIRMESKECILRM